MLFCRVSPVKSARSVGWPGSHTQYNHPNDEHQQYYSGQGDDTIYDNIRVCR